VLSLDIRNVFFTQLDFGYGAALGVLVAAGLIVVAICIWIFRRAWLQSRRRLVRGVAITRSRTVVRSAS
jgi:ABC-type sugar transport system permease subunit